MLLPNANLPLSFVPVCESQALTFLQASQLAIANRKLAMPSLRRYWERCLTSPRRPFIRNLHLPLTGHLDFCATAIDAGRLRCRESRGDIHLRHRPHLRHVKRQSDCAYVHRLA